MSRAEVTNGYKYLYLSRAEVTSRGYKRLQIFPILIRYGRKLHLDRATLASFAPERTNIWSSCHEPRLQTSRIAGCRAAAAAGCSGTRGFVICFGCPSAQKLSCAVQSMVWGWGNRGLDIHRDMPDSELFGISRQVKMAKTFNWMPVRTLPYRRLRFHGGTPAAGRALLHIANALLSIQNVFQSR